MIRLADIAREDYAQDLAELPEMDLSSMDFAPDDAESSVLYEQLNGIDCALEAIVSTHLLIDKLKQKPNDRFTVRMAAIAFEDIKRSVGFNEPTDIIAIEAFSDNGVAMEGLKSFIDSIWDAIVRTFKALWNGLLSLFKTNKIDKTVEAAEQTVSDVDKDIRERKHSPKAKPTQASSASNHSTAVKEVKASLTASESVIKHFSYMGKKITVSDLLTELQKTKKTIDAVGSIALSVERANMNMREAVKQFASSGITGKGNSFASKAVNCYYESVTRGFTKGGDLHPYRDELLQKLSVPYNKVDREYTYHLDGFTRGVKIFAFMTAISGVETLEDSTFKFFISKDSGNELSDDDLTINDLEQVSAYGHEVVRTLTGYQHFNSELSDISGHIVRLQQGLIDEISVFAKHAEGSEKETVERFQYYREVTKALVAMGYDLLRFDKACANTAFDHSKLLQYIYPKVVNSVQD